MLKPFRSHGWSAEIVLQAEHLDCIEIAASRDEVETRIAVLYSGSGISNTHHRELSTRVERIFSPGQPHMPDASSRGVAVPVESLDNFFAFLVDLSKQLQSERSSPAIPHRSPTVRRLTAENPLDAVIARLQRFTSETLAPKLVERRAVAENTPLEPATAQTKANGVAFSMRSALD